MMYASKIIIETEPQLINYQKDVNFWDEEFTLKKLAKYVKDDESFYVYPIEGTQFQKGGYLLEIHGKRLETQKELKTRIAKDTLYNKNYENFHAKYSKNNSK